MLWVKEILFLLPGPDPAANPACSMKPTRLAPAPSLSVAEALTPCLCSPPVGLGLSTRAPLIRGFLPLNPLLTGAPSIPGDLQLPCPSYWSRRLPPLLQNQLHHVRYLRPSCPPAWMSRHLALLRRRARYLFHVRCTEAMHVDEPLHNKLHATLSAGLYCHVCAA
jgi:hypothetical protein